MVVFCSIGYFILSNPNIEFRKKKFTSYSPIMMVDMKMCLKCKMDFICSNFNKLYGCLYISVLHDGLYWFICSSKHQPFLTNIIMTHGSGFSACGFWNLINRNALKTMVKLILLAGRYIPSILH